MSTLGAPRPRTVKARAKAARAARTRPLAIGYTRVSTAEQAEDGASLASQEVELRAEADRRGWDFELITDAGVSGKSIDARPGLLTALARLDSGAADILLSVKLDRISRSVLDFGLLASRALDAGWDMRVLDFDLDMTSSTGRMFANIMASFAQYFREDIGDKTRAGLAQRRREGVVLGRPRQVSDDVVARILAGVRAGRSYGAIARALNDEDVPTVHGGRRWYPMTVRNIALAA